MKKVTNTILGLTLLGAISAFGANGEALFKKCSACHGMNAEKAALGKSQIIKGWAADKTVKALKGYKDGTYGGAMKGVMKGQVMALNDEQITALAKYIETK